LQAALVFEASAALTSIFASRFLFFGLRPVRTTGLPATSARAGHPRQMAETASHKKADVVKPP
jgi:hypothetical protein